MKAGRSQSRRYVKIKIYTYPMRLVAARVPLIFSDWSDF